MTNLESEKLITEEFTEFKTLESLTKHFSKLGCNTLIGKALSKEDDSKHQIFLSSVAPLAQLLPGDLETRGVSSSTTKRLSDSGSRIFSLRLDFDWVQANGIQENAREAKIIEYPQYPEVRFSGFLKGCKQPPRCLSGTKQLEYGQRVMFLGIAGRKIFGTIATSFFSPQIVTEFGRLKPWALANTFSVIPLGRFDPSDRSRLLSEVGALCGTAHQPQVLDPGADLPRLVPWTTQSAGWTLEALLGVPRNSARSPDKFGYEIKAVGSGKVSLITTEPDFGLRHDLGLGEFLHKHGAEAAGDPDKRVFNGIHRAWEVNSKTNAILEITGWNRDSNRPSGEGNLGVVLRDAGNDEILSGWSIEKLAHHWVKKHSAAFYLEALKQGAVGFETIMYGPSALLGEGTSIEKFLRLVSAGTIFLDPGDSLKGGKTHARTQWRINGNIRTSLEPRLEPLYFDLSAKSFASL